MKAETGLVVVAIVPLTCVSLALFVPPIAGMLATANAHFDRVLTGIEIFFVALFGISLFLGFFYGFVEILSKWHDRKIAKVDGKVFVLQNGEYVDPRPIQVQAIEAASTGHARHNKTLGKGATTAIANGFQEPIPGDYTITKPDPPLLEAPSNDIMPFTGQSFDLHTSPHFLIVGESGSGKSNTVRIIANELKRRYVHADFIICEPDAADWKRQAFASEKTHIARTIIGMSEEVSRRLTAVSESNVSEYAELPGTKRIIFIVEETESAIDDLKLLDRKLSQETLLAFRNIARRGRKASINLITVTQLAKADVYDSHVRTNMGNRYFHKCPKNVTEMFRLKMDLSTLPSGQCYSANDAGMVQVPFLRDVAVPLADPVALRLPQPPAQPLLPETTAQPQSPTTPVVSALQPQPLRLDSGRQPTPEQARIIRNMYADGMSMKQICFSVWGYKDGVTHGYTRQAIDGEL